MGRRARAVARLVSAAEPDLLDTTDAGPAALRGGALRGAGYALGLLLALAAAPLLIRHLGQEQFGRYVAILSVVVVVAGFTEAGLNTIALREFASLHGAERDRVFANALGLRLALSAGAIVLATGFAIVAGYGASLALGACLASIGLLLQTLQTFLTVALQGGLRFGLATIADIIRQLVTVVAIVVLIVADAGTVSFFAVGIVSGLVAVSLTLAFVRGLIPLRPVFTPTAWWPLLRDTFPFAVAIALNTAYFRVAVVIMSLTATELQTGYFSTSFRIMEVLIGVPGLIVGAAFPILTRAARDDPARFAAATRRIFELGVLAGTGIAVAIGLGAGFAIDVLGGADAAPAAAVLRIQGMAMVATFVANACGFPLLSLRRNRAIMIANAVALTFSVVLTVALVPRFQAQGAAVAAVVAETALAVVTASLLQRAQPTLRLPMSVVPVAAVAAGAGVGVALLIGGPDVVRAPVGLAGFVVAITVLGRFPPEVNHALTARRGAPAAR